MPPTLPTHAEPVIYKFRLQPHGCTQFELPQNCTVLSVGYQIGAGLVAWILFPPITDQTVWWVRTFIVVFTGEPVWARSVKSKYVGTIEGPPGIINHVFVGEPETITGRPQPTCMAIG